MTAKSSSDFNIEWSGSVSGLKQWIDRINLKSVVHLH